MVSGILYGVEVRTFFVDSFTREPFRGNPAAVCLLPHAVEEATMQKIATEFGLSETAFVLEDTIRYFSPKMEIPLCGHATLAAAKVLFSLSDRAELTFTTGSGVVIPILRKESGQISFSFPSEGLRPGAISDAALEALGLGNGGKVWAAAATPVLVVEVDDPQVLRDLKPDFVRLEASCEGISGIVVTAPGGEGYDYELRYFWPWSGTNEDPVTGGVQRFVAPLWARKLGKSVLRAYQRSPRGGEICLGVFDERVDLSGDAVILLEGRLKL